MIIINDELKLRRLKDIENDYRYLEKWYKEKEVYHAFEQRVLSYEEIKNKYYERTLDNTKVPVYMIEYKSIPIGIIQYKEVEKNKYEIDIFIGDINLHNKGIGHLVINKMCEYLFNNNAKEIIMCPLKDNLKAINCYKKCGFSIEKEFTDKDTIGNKQVYLLMKKEKNMNNEYEYVVNNSKYVTIDYDKLDSFIKEIKENNYSHWSNNFNLNITEEEWILLCFIIESMNFCFWKKPKWIMEYKGNTFSGSNALFNSIIKEVENNKEFFNIDYLNKLNKEEFNKIFEGIEGICPFLDKRFNNFKEVVNYIKNHDFYNELYSINSDIELLNYITSNFKCFDDKSNYKGKTIHFNKRANLLVNDLFNVSSKIKNNIKSVSNLFGCADYGIPRTFREYGILNYNKELANLVDNEKEVKHDSEMEIEIRANMLYVIEIIKEELNKRNIKVNSIELDNIIWLMGKRIGHNTPVHHTETIYY